jgi:hypothetical protein
VYVGVGSCMQQGVRLGNDGSRGTLIARQALSVQGATRSRRLLRLTASLLPFLFLEVMTM